MFQCRLTGRILDFIDHQPYVTKPAEEFSTSSIASASGSYMLTHPTKHKNAPRRQLSSKGTPTTYSSLQQVHEYLRDNGASSLESRSPYKYWQNEALGRFLASAKYAKCSSYCWNDIFTDHKKNVQKGKTGFYIYLVLRDDFRVFTEEDARRGRRTDSA